MIARSAALTFACLLLLAPGAQAAGDTPPRTITVSGQGEVKSAPDEAQLSAGVVTEATSAADALSMNSKAMTRVFETLKQLGIPQKDMQTSDFSVSPQYTTYKNGNGGTSQRLSGYQVSNTVSVTIDDLAKVGPAIDVLVGSGANSLGGVSFTIRDPKPLQMQARAAAVRDAMDRAAAYAKAAGVQTGPILSISEGDVGEPRPMFRAMSFAAVPAAPPPPIATGEQSVSATVTMTIQIQ